MSEGRGVLRQLRWTLFGVAVGSLIAVGLLELYLRVRQPVPLRLRGSSIVLPVNEVYEVDNTRLPKLDRRIRHTKNSIGFRGPPPPGDFPDSLTIVSIGGSTTECFFQSDDKTWTALLESKLDANFDPLWVNNAGLDGHSVFGHIALVEDHVSKLGPRVAIFLVGRNELGQRGFGPFELANLRGRLDDSSFRGFVRGVANHSQTAALVLALYRYATNWQLHHLQVDLQARAPAEATPPAEASATLELHRDRFLPGYEERLRELLRLTRRSDIVPVLVTQPALHGGGVDDLTGVDLARVPCCRVHVPGSGEPALEEVPGALAWDVLELYNDVTRRVGRSEDVVLVDLARQLPKTSRFYYDFVHYTNEGAEAIAGILYRELCPALAERFPGHLTASCSQDDP